MVHLYSGFVGNFLISGGDSYAKWKDKGIPSKQKNTTKSQKWKELDETDINNLPDKEFKITVINIFTEFGIEWMNSMKISRERQKI